MGELQHGSYDYDDECEGLTGEEINAFYGFAEDGELLVLDATSDQGLDDSEDSDSDNNEDQNESGSEDNVINLDFITSLT